MPTHLAIMDVTPNKRGSFENYAVSLAARLRAEGWRTVQAFWGPPPTWLADELEELGASVFVLSDAPEFGGVRDVPAGLGRDLALSRVSRRLVRQHRPDIVHLHFCLAYSILPLALRLAGARRVVFTEHISLPFAKRDPLRDLAARLRNGLAMSVIDRALPVSAYVRRRLVESDHVPAHKAQVLYNGIDLSRFQPGAGADPAQVRRRLEVPDGRRIILTIGQLIEFKGMHVLIDAVAELEDAHDCQLLFVGEGDMRPELEAQVARLDLGERVRFLGRRDDIADLLRATDVFACPSIWDEALGYVILEAMAVERAVVATRTGGIPEVVVEGKTGRLVERNDAAALARAISDLLADDEARRAMGVAGRRRVEDVFSMDVSIDQTLELYTELTGAAGAAPRSGRLRGAA